jgi:hypothetical protein
MVDFEQTGPRAEKKNWKYRSRCLEDTHGTKYKTINCSLQEIVSISSTSSVVPVLRIPAAAQNYQKIHMFC